MVTVRHGFSIEGTTDIRSAASSSRSLAATSVKASGLGSHTKVAVLGEKLSSAVEETVVPHGYRRNCSYEPHQGRGLIVLATCA